MTVLPSQIEAYQYALAMVKPLQEICAPLINNLNIAHVAYNCFRSDGSFIYVATNSSAVQHAYEFALEKRYIFDFISELKQYPQYMLVAQNENDLKKPLYASAYEINMWKGFYLYEWKNNSVAFLCFFGKRDWYEDSTNFYINHLPLLKRFFIYFKSKAYRIINPSKKKLYGLIRSNILYKDNLIKPTLPRTFNITCDNLQNFLRETSLKKYILDFQEQPISFSRREIQTLLCISKGYSIKETAQSLVLSPRTVEHYVNNLKLKTKSQNKKDIISLAEHFNFEDETFII